MNYGQRSSVATFDRPRDDAQFATEGGVTVLDGPPAPRSKAPRGARFPRITEPEATDSAVEPTSTTTTEQAAESVALPLVPRKPRGARFPRLLEADEESPAEEPKPARRPVRDVAPSPEPRPPNGNRPRNGHPGPHGSPARKPTPSPRHLLREDPEPAYDAPHTPVSLVRPYARTQGRTRPRFDLAVEVLVSACPGSRQLSHPAHPEYSAICQACGSARSVAEIAAVLRMPLAVARVLISDMAHLGLVNIHRTATGGDKPTRQFLERVLQGLYQL